MSNALVQHPFDAIVDNNSKILILGSFPSLKSFEQNFYYAHPRNQFWPILEKLFSVTLDSNAKREAFVREKNIALWDTYGALRREASNSSDRNLKDLQVNDFETFFRTYPKIRHVLFTGRKAQEGFEKHYSEMPISKTLLPSTSPAYAAMKFDEKLEKYGIIKEILGD